MRRSARYWIAAALLIAAGILWLASRPLLEIETFGGTAENTPPESVLLNASEIEQRLLAVGLHPTGQLSDLGVDDHLARLAAGEVDAATLGAYADAIEALSATNTDRGQSLPPTLWDVSTPALRDAGWTVYTLTEALASEDGAVHVALLSDAYAAFLEHRPNALDGALALLPLSRAYVDTLPEGARAERERHAQTDGQATLLIWQALLSGTSRHNPLTHRPLWSHGYVGHFSVPHIHQYATGEGLTASQVWGVEGFSPAFVGPPANSNQVEHLGISALLQGVAHVPGAVLTATEAFEVFIDHEDPAAAQADRALNEAVRTVLLPRIEGDPDALVSALAEALR